MKILFIHSLMFHHKTWQQAAEQLTRDGITLYLTDQMSTPGFLENPVSQDMDLLIAEFALGLPGVEALLDRSRTIAHRIGLSPEIPAEFSTFAPEIQAEFKRYIHTVSLINYVNGIRFLASCSGRPLSYEPPAPVRTTGIYHPEAPHAFEDVETYWKWLTGRMEATEAPCIGLLFYYSQLAEENTTDVDALIQALESHGLAPMAVFCDYTGDVADTRPPAWMTFFRHAPAVELILSLMAGCLLKNNEPEDTLCMLDVPVVQLLRSHSQTPEQWRDDPQGLPAMTTIYSLAQPETCGVIAPVLVAGSQQNGAKAQGIGYRPFLPIDERIETLCRRIQRWVRLRRMANAEKQITFVLHNNPCKGVEATVGMAAGLDTFESLARVLQAMKAAGYDIGQAPTRGRDLLAAIMDRKAISEFRWTTKDEILVKGGALYQMDAAEYVPWFQTLPESARNKVLADWDTFPGQGMVFSENGREGVVITGIQYGQIRIMVQPKRGCYGAKCTGEVCRILHDPELAPPHHWLATYKYIQENSDAVVHFGTEGALEFLPGKQAALSDACFPEISIGDLPNLYVYVLDATGEGLIAKRRGQAVLVDHLSPVHRPAPIDEEVSRLADLLEQYRNAHQMRENQRLEKIAVELEPLLLDLHVVAQPPAKEEWPTIVDQARRQIALARQALMPEGLHLLGNPPDSVAMGRRLAALLRVPPPDLPDMQTIAQWSAENDADDFERAAGLLARIAAGHAEDLPGAHSALNAFCRDAAKRLNHCGNEISHLLAGLSGRFIPPGLSGSLSRGRIDMLPTGRNFFATDVTTLPTQAAWLVGQQLADKLLVKYLKEENRFPESIGVSMWSTDAFKSDGELLCQVLYLMGVCPVWHPSGRVTDIEVIPLDQLTLEQPDGPALVRPRVDVTVQTSGIMRDMVPNFCELLDKAVIRLSRLEEPEDRNFIRKHTRQQMAKLREQTQEQLSDHQVHRMATVRIFSSAPGTYGVGVGLALDASAWQDGNDLAEAYINWGGHAYGYDGDQTLCYGLPAQQLLADQLARIDVAYMKQSSAEYDLLDCGCYAVCQGGMAAAASAIARQSPRLYWGDSTTPQDTDIRDVASEIKRTAMAKLLNPTWIAHMQDHAFQGAQTVSGCVNTLFKWSATTQTVGTELFNAVVDTYILNAENRDWLRQVNPYALEEITRRLMEAASRDLWTADAERLAAVQSVALEIEGDMEESMGEVTEDFQGSKVEVLTADNVAKWQYKWRMEAPNS